MRPGLVAPVLTIAAACGSSGTSSSPAGDAGPDGKPVATGDGGPVAMGDSGAGGMTDGASTAPGDASGPFDCRSFDACGGNPTGSWSLVAACDFQQQCPGAMVTGGSFTASGTYAFNANSTYTTSQTIGGTVNETVPVSCVAGMSCLPQISFGPFSDACTGSQTCTCTVSTQSFPMDQGTWSTSGSMLLLASSALSEAGVGPEPYTYCVQGSSLVVADGYKDLFSFTKM
jgi:hypothetical protein